MHGSGNTVGFKFFPFKLPRHLEEPAKKGDNVACSIVFLFITHTYNQETAPTRQATEPHLHLLLNHFPVTTLRWQEHQVKRQ